ncbi:MAG: hypothetical protein QM820_16870 [Minicystis sp.]
MRSGSSIDALVPASHGAMSFRPVSHALAPVTNELAGWAGLAESGAHVARAKGIVAQLQTAPSRRVQEGIVVDLLFYTQRRAKQMSLVAAEDPLVAAMFAGEWLAAVEHVAPEHFRELENMQRWSAAVSRLEAIRGHLTDPAQRAKADGVWALLKEVRGILRELGDPHAAEAQLATLQRRRAELGEQRAGAQRRAVICFVVAFFVLIFVGAALSAVLAAFALGVVLPVFLGLLLAGASALAGGQRAQTELARVEQDLARIESTLGRLRAFAADPSRGGDLQRFHAHHPAYARRLPRVEDGESLSATPLRVRCKYCRAATRMEGPRCENCGAAPFV